MTIEEIEAVVAKVLPMRPPTFGPDTGGAEKVSKIEDYMLKAAYIHAELEEALYWLDALVEHFKGMVEQMTGWEVALPSGKRGDRVTRDDVLRAKRQCDPTTFNAGSRARQLRETIKRQINRLEYETGLGVMSRAYTLISGG